MFANNKQQQQQYHQQQQQQASKKAKKNAIDNKANKHTKPIKKQAKR